jgi:hypothetical protein
VNNDNGVAFDPSLVRKALVQYGRNWQVGSVRLKKPFVKGGVGIEQRCCLLRRIVQQTLEDSARAYVLTCRESRGCSGRTISASGDLPMPSRRVRHAGGYLRSESPDRVRGRQDVEVGIADVCGDRLPEYRAAEAAVQEQRLPEVGALG